MTVTEAHARELERQAARKAELRDACERALAAAEPLTFEAGCGHGHWLTDYAQAHPAETCVGIDLISWRIRKAQAKRDKRALKHLHFFKADLGEFLAALPEGVTLKRSIFLFPDPWPKARHHKRRMIQPELLSQLAARTMREGRLYFRSDDRDYFEWATEHLEAHPDWALEPDAEWLFEAPTYFQGLMERYFSLVARRVEGHSL